MNMERMAISATMVIMITTIVATSTALAASDATIRTYGEDVRSAAFPYMGTEAPFDPPSDVAPSNDFVDKHDTTYGTVQATGRSYRMRFRMPIADNDDARISIDGCDVDFDGKDDWVVLRGVRPQDM